MNRRSGRLLIVGAAILFAVPALAPAARAEDFLTALFGAFHAGRPDAPSMPLPFASESQANAPALSVEGRQRFAGGQAQRPQPARRVEQGR